MIALLVLVLALASSAHAQPPALPGGWTMHERIAPSGIEDLGCARDVAYVRDWSGTVARWDGETWTPLPRRSRSMYGRTLGVTPDGALFMESSGGIAQWDGAGWIDHALPRWEGEIDSTFAAISRDEIYYPGRGRIARWDGRGWSTYDPGTWRELRAVALAGDDLLIGGQGGTILRVHEGRTTREDTGIETTILELVALAPDDVWARAEGPSWNASIVLHSDGHAWSRRDPPAAITGLGGTRDAVYVTGDLGLARWSGTSWTVELTPADLGGGYHALADVCATDHHVIVADAGGHALVRPRRP